MPFGPEPSAAAIARDLIVQATSAGALSDDLTVGVLRRTGVPAPVFAHADPVLKDLVPKFLSRRWQDMTVIGEELARGEFKVIERMGHNMKGTGRSYGFDGISEIGAALETAAQTHDAAAIRRQVTALRDYLTRLHGAG
jgi:HPt (histidine-containing phosphotransfer) domain-containing protein